MCQEKIKSGTATCDKVITTRTRRLGLSQSGLRLHRPASPVTMYIKTLTIQGFKSYRDQVSVEVTSPRRCMTDLQRVADRYRALQVSMLDASSFYRILICPHSPGHNVVVGRNGSGKSNFFAGKYTSFPTALTSHSPPLSLTKQLSASYSPMRIPPCLAKNASPCYMKVYQSPPP